MWRKYFDWRIWASLIPIVGGILLTSVTEMSFNMFGFCAALLGCLATSTKTILAESLLHGYKFDRYYLYARNFYCLQLYTLAFFLLFLYFSVWNSGFSHTYRLSTSQPFVSVRPIPCNGQQALKSYIIFISPFLLTSLRYRLSILYCSLGVRTSMGAAKFDCSKPANVLTNQNLLNLASHKSGLRMSSFVVKC